MAYTDKIWNTGDIVHAVDMNNIEKGLKRVHQTVDGINFSSFALKSEIPNVSNFATFDDLPDISGLAEKSEIPDVSGLATKSEVELLPTVAEVQDMINDIPPADLSNYATKAFVTNAINEAELAGSEGEIDLSVYALKTEVEGKVDKVAGKGLSTNDFTNVEKDKLANLSNFDPSSLQTSINNKVDKETGKGLSSNDYTTAEKSKLGGIEAGAQKNPDLTPYALKTDLKDATQMEFNGVPLDGLKRYVYDTTATDGEWSINYADRGFTTFVNVYFYSIAKGTALADRTIPTLKQGQPTLTSCSGYLMSASSAGLLAAMTLVNGNGPVRVIVEGV